MQSGKWQVQLKGFSLTHDFGFFLLTPDFLISPTRCVLSLSRIAMHNALTFYFARKTCQWEE